MSVGIITIGAFVLLGGAIVAQTVTAFRTIGMLNDGPAANRWRATLFLLPLFVAGYLGSLSAVVVGSDPYPGLLVGTLCLFGAGFINMAVRNRYAGQEVAERKQLERRLQHSATHDSLTGLPNSELFVHRLNQVLDRRNTRNANYIFAVLHVDVDRLKVINESLGHSIGDRLLQIAAERLGRCIRASDTIARFGGDEFMILLDGIADVSDAVRVADRIQQDMAPEIRIGEHELCSAASIGIVLSESGYLKADDVIRDAEIALSRAKSAGGARHEIFDPAMRDRMTDRLSMETELRQALERGEFRLAYQPIIELATGNLSGFEALVRWQHPDRGTVAPYHFIDFAERTGQIIAIDRWVLREACRQMKEWQVRFPMKTPLMISTNLSSKQFTQSDLIPCITDVLLDTGLDPACLEVELTENAFIEKLEPIKATLDLLKKLGIGLKLDDFGTGYSSLSYLHRLPFDFLKIDRSFVMKMSDSGTDLAIVHTVLLLAQALDIRVVAEGVETEQHLSQLKELHCDFAQGYLFSKPVPPTEAEEIIRKSFERAARAPVPVG